jgi:HSP20 family protein
MTSELDRMLESPVSLFAWPASGAATTNVAAWSPGIDVFEKDNRLITKVDLPGLKKEDVKVELTDGHLVISGERKTEAEEKKGDFYRCERAYGSFFRAVPLPAGVKTEDVKASFADGVLEVTMPLPARPASAVKTIEIQEAPKAAKPAA